MTSHKKQELFIVKFRQNITYVFQRKLSYYIKKATFRKTMAFSIIFLRTY